MNISITEEEAQELITFFEMELDKTDERIVELKQLMESLDEADEEEEEEPAEEEPDEPVALEETEPIEDTAEETEEVEGTEEVVEHEEEHTSEQKKHRRKRITSKKVELPKNVSEVHESVHVEKKRKALEFNFPQKTETPSSENSEKKFNPFEEKKKH